MSLDLSSVGTLTFEACEKMPSPCLSLAKEALLFGKGCEIVLNVANEVAVDAFLHGHIAFSDIAKVVALSCKRYKETRSFESFTTVKNIVLQDSLSRCEAENIIQEKAFI